MHTAFLEFLFTQRFSILASLVVVAATLVITQIVLSRLRVLLEKSRFAPESHSLMLLTVRLFLYGTAVWIILTIFDLTRTPIWVSLVQPIMEVLVTAVLGFAGIQILLHAASRLLARSKLDATMHPFLLTVTRIGLYVLLVLILLPKLHIEITPILTALGAVGLAVSLAVKDSLANLMGGALVLISKPFVAGDFVEIGSLSGTVTEVGPIYTFLNTVDNKRICIPNGQVSSSQVVNYSAEPLRRLDLTFSIAYGDDFQKAKKIIRQVVEQHPQALADPAPVIRMAEHGPSSIDLTCRVWVDNQEYWNLKFDLLEEVKLAFDREGINIPFPQMDVHLKQD